MSSTAPAIKPLHFGPSNRRLFGIVHAPAPTAAARAGVVLCNPFGQEAVRSQRMMRVLAERLASDGSGVLRFDYYGTGDSPGDDLDGDIVGWAGDVLEADLELRRSSGATSTLWIGMRVGATVALQAARQAPEGLARLVLWDPVLDGQRYLEHLRTRHVASLVEAYSVPPEPSPLELARDPGRFREEAIGFALSPRMRQQIEALTVAEFVWPARPSTIIVLTDPDDVDGGDLALARARAPERVQAITVRHGTDWTSDLAGNSALVPAAALMQLRQQGGATL